MWGQYGNAGVAICSHYGLLKAAVDAMPDRAMLGLVRYSFDHVGWNILRFITTKRPKFADEREVRALIWKPEWAGQDGARNVEEYETRLRQNAGNLANLNNYLSESSRGPDAARVRRGRHDAGSARPRRRPQGREILCRGQALYRPKRAQPYFYSDHEIRTLLKAAKNRPSIDPLRPWTYHCLFGLLAVTGLRLRDRHLRQPGDRRLDAHLGRYTHLRVLRASTT
jgi:hypothetical protein